MFKTFIQRVLMTAAGLFTALSVQAAIQVEGFPVDETVIENGIKFVLNGTAVRKRSYYKTELVALYLPERTSNPDQIFKANKPTLIRRIVLRDFSMGTVSRYFFSDFKQVSTDAEFKQVINSVSTIGAAYGSINRLVKGDVIDTIWIPKTGMTGRHNGKPLADTGNDELFWQIYLRMFIGTTLPEDFRNGLLGQKSS